MNSISKLRGVFPVFQTPFHEDESIDAGTLHREIEWLYDSGCDGIVMAMVSEVGRLDVREREQLAELACKFGSARGAVVISVGTESSLCSERLAKHAASVGADALMAIPPAATAVCEDELLRYYDRLLDASSLPVIVQDASGYVGKPMTIQFQAGLFRRYGSRILFKPEATPIGPRLSQLRDATGGKAPVFEGTGGISLVDSFRRGIAGTMPGADLICGIMALWRALQRGDDQKIYQLSLPISALIAVQNSLDAFIAVEKYLLVKQGIFRNTVVRGPVGYKLDDETRQEVDRLFCMIENTLEHQLVSHCDENRP